MNMCTNSPIQDSWLSDLVFKEARETELILLWGKNLLQYKKISLIDNTVCLH
jgi:hypothetical protein